MSDKSLLSFFKYYGTAPLTSIATSPEKVSNLPDPFTMKVAYGSHKEVKSGLFLVMNSEGQKTIFSFSRDQAENLLHLITKALSDGEKWLPSEEELFSLSQTYGKDNLNLNG